jgi:segregation and condensation protein B
MSLKAKLEAVIYAAEEPVTLTQLAQLFAADALEWKAAQAAAAAEQAAEIAGDAPEPGQPMPLLSEGLEYLGLEDAPAVYAEPLLAASESALAPEESPADTTEAQPPDDDEKTILAADSVEEALDNPAAESPADAEADARRVARQRDREVKAVLKQLLDELIAACLADGRGVEIREIAGGYRMATKPECHDAVRMFVKSLKPAMKLSLPALETLAVIAYKQPVTAPEVNEIRGVESAGVLGSLLARKLIATAGRKPVIGRPILYKTTKEFLLRFGLKDVNDLPSMEEFEKMAGELAESEAEGEAQDVINLSSEAATPAEEAAPVEAEQPSAESSEQVAATSEEGAPSSEEATAEAQTEPEPEHQV